MISTTANARERVRLILDRVDSSWLTNTEIDGFLEQSINEFVRERVNSFGANQEIRDDFGRFVRSVTFSLPTITTQQVGELLQTTVLPLEGTFALSVPENPDSPEFSENIVEYSSTGVSFRPFNDSGNLENLDVGTVLSLRVVSDMAESQEIDILSIDNAIKTRQDPFNSPSTNSYVAVKTDDVYWIQPPIANTLTNIDDFTAELIAQLTEAGALESVTVFESRRVVMTYISSNNVVGMITLLPIHAREEVCQIAARKILGTVGDETYATVGDSEVKQLKGK
jgi:hypothetical protein